MKHLWKIILASSVSAASSGDEHNTELINEVTDNISSELVECGAYFTLSAEAIRQTGRGSLANDYEELSTVAFDRALVAAETSRTTHMAEKVTLARYELFLKDMVGEMDSNFSNISILMNRYAARCTTVIEQPLRTGKEWVRKLINK